MGKGLSINNLLSDLGYIVSGTDAQARLFEIFPPVEGKIILEPGCGSGKFGLSYAMAGCESIMIDIDPEVVEYSRRLRNALNALRGFPLPTQIRYGNLFRMKFADNSFDLVFSEGVIDHFSDVERRQKVLDCMTRVSRGLVVVMVSNGLNPKEVEEDEKITFTYMGMPPKRQSFKPDELMMRLKNAGLVDIYVEPLYPQVPKESPILVGWGKKK